VARQRLSLWVWPVALVIVGVLALLHNYLILDFNVLQLWPLVLVLLGLQALLQGDVGFSWAGQHFGITRGSVEAASLRADGGELDVHIHALQREGRLIAGQYTARSRPHLQVDGNHAALTMLRSRTWFFSLANWDFGLAKDVPWELLVSTHLGEIEIDLCGLIVGQARITTGFGDIHLIGPDSPAGPIVVRSTLGDIYLTVPDGVEAAVTVVGGPMLDVRVQDERWQPRGERRYTTPGYDGAIEPLEFTVSGTFGSLLLF